MRELPNRRTPTSDTFLLSDGSLESRLFEVPINYRDEEGDWQRIRERLEETADGGVTNGANSFDVHLPEDLNEAPIRVSLQDAWVSEMPLDVQSAAVEMQPDGSASYPAAGGATEFSFDSLSNGLKESIELGDPTAPTSYRYQVDASDGVAPSLAEGGSISFLDQDGKPVAQMPAPTMIDAAEIQAPAGAVHYDLQQSGEGAWEVTVAADSEWLQAEDRSWPVVIDPTVEVKQPALDCLIVNDGAETARCGPSETALVAKANYVSSGTDPIARSLLRFDTSAIPKTASLTTATIGLYSPKTATNITKVDMYDVSSTWTNGVTWRWWDTFHKPSKNEWVSKGGDYGKYMPTPTSLTPAERGGSGAGLWKFTGPELTWLTQRWLEGTVPDNGVLLKLADETPHVCCFERRVQWESSAGTNKPYLAVQYVKPFEPATKANMTSPSDGTKTAKRFLLTASWQDAMEGITFQYKTEASQGWKDIPAAQVIDANNQTVSWPYSIPKLEERKSRPLYWDASSLTDTNPSAKVAIRALIKDLGGESRYTRPVDTEVDKNLGGPKDAATSVGPGSVDLLTGSFTVSRTDVSVPGFGAALEFSRSFSSRQAEAEPNGVLGPGWKPASPVEQAGGASWTKLVLKEESEEFEEGGSFTYKWAELTHSEGGVLSFEEEGGNFTTPPEMSGYVLAWLNSEHTQVAFTDPAGNRTVFTKNGSSNEYLPSSVAMTGGPGNNSRMIYEPNGSKLRLKEVIAPAAPGVSCSDEYATSTEGCRALTFSYGTPEGTSVTRLVSITYFAPGQGGPWGVAAYKYDTSGRLIATWDPRISPNLKETYTYNPTGQIATLTPPGQEPWTMQYTTLAGDPAQGRLASVKRASLVESKTAQTTIAYGVPLTKAGGGPYDMGGAAVAAWGQTDLPTDAAAVFPPDEVPGSPPSSYTRAAVYYMDAEGQLSNVATPSGAGT
ncbi:MAG TPA: DNRLRE domain-containing protein, partial [Arthrobacter sp.]|nr:DNRLRE domain-containing protein [Arthrobacter sp.]